MLTPDDDGQMQYPTMHATRVGMVDRQTLERRALKSVLVDEAEDLKQVNQQEWSGITGEKPWLSGNGLTRTSNRSKRSDRHSQGQIHADKRLSTTCCT